MIPQKIMSYDPSKAESSKIFPFSLKILDMIDNLTNKWHTDPRFINNDYLTFPFITLKVQDIHYLFSKSIPFTFFAILFFEVPMWSTRFSHPKVTIPRKKRASKSCDSRRVLNPKVTRVVTFGTLR